MPGGGGRKGVGQIFQGDGTGGVAVRGGDVGAYPEDGAVTGYLQHGGSPGDNRGEGGLVAGSILL